MKTLQRQHDPSARRRAADHAAAAPAVLPAPMQQPGERLPGFRMHAASHAASGSFVADAGLQSRPASPRTVRQRLEFGATIEQRSGSELEHVLQGNAWTAARGVHVLESPAAEAAVSVTPITGAARGTDSSNLKQPADGAAAESPTQSKLRSLLKVPAVSLAVGWGH